MADRLDPGHPGHLDDAELVAVVLGRAGPTDRDHARACPACRDRLAEWSAVRAAAVVVAARPTRPVPATLIDEVLAAARRPPPARAPVPAVRPGPRLAWAGRLLAAQVPLLRRSLLAASGLMFLLGVLVVATGRSGAGLLAAVVPAAAAVGLALLHGPEVDPAVELTATTGTSPRVVLLARLVLVLALDLVLALAATAVARLGSADVAFGALVTSWFGPLLLLSALSFALAVLTRPAIGMAVALGLWLLRLSALWPETEFGRLPLAIDRLDGFARVWNTSLPTIAAALALIALTLAVTPRRMRFAG
ncbi:MAG TPA: hypothetical protein VMU51_30515 [Mycobacteriales bacterium]|nr:hypothetical protein [Mycobacteriales bacterium]